MKGVLERRRRFVLQWLVFGLLVSGCRERAPQTANDSGPGQSPPGGGGAGLIAEPNLSLPAAPTVSPRTWTFSQEGTMRAQRGTWSFKSGGRVDALFVGFRSNNSAIVLKFNTDHQDYVMPF